MAYAAVLEAREIASKKMGTFREAMKVRDERKTGEKAAEDKARHREQVKKQPK